MTGHSSLFFFAPGQERMKNLRAFSGRKPSGVWNPYDNSSGLLAGVGSMAQDGQGYLWLGTFGGGLSRYDGVHFVNHTTADGLLDNRIRSVIADKEDTVWLRDWNHTLYSFDETRFTVHTQPGGPLSAVVCMCKDRRGRLWFCTLEGEVYCRENGSFAKRAFHSEPFGPHHNACLFCDSRDNIWIGKHEGIWLLAPDGSFRKFTIDDGLIHNYVRAICEDLEGRLWLGTEAVACRASTGLSLSITTPRMG